ncbi:MAG: sigma 54-interacting transcriptional regulator [Polyangiaceae bacterium]|nr:sigma 54-interacting transcriptional regulator [Polyangiaceae bacterium]
MEQLDLYRELFRHERLEAAVAAILPLLAEQFGVRAIALRRLDLHRRALATIAEAHLGDWTRTAPMVTECSREDIERLLTWSRSGEVRQGRAESDPILALLAARAADVDTLAGPITDTEVGPLGALLLFGDIGSFGARHTKQLEELLDPFRVALLHAQRTQELTRLREVVEADNRALLSKLDRQGLIEEIVGADAGFRAVIQRVEQVAPTDAPVLLLGETGTGKEVVARAIHARSRRPEGPMLRVNCGAIPPGLIDSELFGHERGSFTGAVAGRAGWFERADGGTLFLDEIGELPLAAQVRLLRVLQDSVIERVGGQRSVPVDVRVVAATHRDLEEMVRAGSFREDLWYRISVFPIVIPPLRDRREDIPELAAHFAWRVGKRIGGVPLAPSQADIDRLLGYDWPGNVRELAAVVERAAILGDGRRLDIAGSLGIRTTSVAPPPPLQTGSMERNYAGEQPLLSLDAAITRHIEAALERSGGRVEGPRGAAVLLGLNPHTLRSKMRRLGIRWGRFRDREPG